MARERSFTDQQVIDAAAAIASNGKTINGTNLRAHIGSGRPDSLMKAYEELVDAGAIVKAQPADLPDVALPPEIDARLKELTAHLGDIVNIINSTAHHHAERYFMDMVKGSEARVAEAETKVQQITLEMEAAFNEAEDAKENAANVSESLATVNAELEATHTALTTTKQQLVSSQGELEKAEEHALALKEKLAEREAKIQSQKEDIASLRRRADSLNDQVTTAKAELATANAELSASRESNSQLTDSLRAMTGERDQKAQLAQQHQRAHSVAESQLSEVRKREEALQQQVENKEATIVELHDKVSRAGGALDAHKTRNSELVAELRAEREKREALADDLKNVNSDLVATQNNLANAADEIHALKQQIASSPNH